MCKNDCKTNCEDKRFCEKDVPINNPQFIFSQGWFYYFKLRYEIKTYHHFEESW